MIITGEHIRKLIASGKPLITGFIDLDKQVQMHGFDLTVSDVFEISGEGIVDFSNAERKIPEARKLETDENGFWTLKPGVYKVKTNEFVNIPLDMGAFAQTRSTLLRMGAQASNGFWDAGFSGKSEFLINVINPNGIKMKKNARVVQIAFFKLSKNVSQGYNGAYKNLE